MRKKRVTRFFCDHCPKGFFKGSSCREHERRCFRNPEREPFEAELYPMPRRNGSDSFEMAAWPAVASWDELGADELHPLSGWEPTSEEEDPWSPHVHLSGRWYPISSEVWKRQAADGVHSALMLEGGGVVEHSDLTPAPDEPDPDEPEDDIPF